MAITLTKKEKELHIEKRKIIPFIVCSLIIVGGLWRNNITMIQNLYPLESERFEQIDKYLDNNKNNLYFINCESLYRRPNASFGSFDKHMYSEPDNLIFLGSHTYGHPTIVEKWKKWGIINPWTKMIKDENSYLIVTKASFEKMETYLKEHYGENYIFELVENINDNDCVYRVEDTNNQ